MRSMWSGVALAFALALAALLPGSAAASDNDWKPIDPADLALKSPTVEKDADAEAIFWDVRVQDEEDPGGGLHTTLRHYIRVKIFTDRGKESQSKIDIVCTGKAAR